MKLWRRKVSLGAAALTSLPFSAARADAPAPPPDTCRLTLTERFIGAKAVPTVRSTLGQIARPNPVRWITPGQPVTIDFSSRRLNVILDETGRIAAMRCG